MTLQPIQWTIEHFKADALTAETIFRRERTDEPLEDYTAFFEKFATAFTHLIDGLNDFANDPEILPQIMRDGTRETALRYITAPPISTADLKTLADTELSATALRQDPEAAQRVRNILLNLLDKHRFPWVSEARNPSDQEKEIAIVSSAALVAAQKVATLRRAKAREQERAVVNLIEQLGFKQAQKKKILYQDDGPPQGHYYGETEIGERRADVVIRLHDRRVLAVESKSSNSAVNSHKRINKEAAIAASQWRGTLGAAVVPCAVISGVFNPQNLLEAQEGDNQRRGISIFWSHRLQDLADFIEATKQGA